MNRRERRRLRPHEQARADQSLAAARNLGASDPTTAVFVVEYADPGLQCCWCDCTVQQHFERGDCDGCPRAADYVVNVDYGTPQQLGYPICEPHHPDFVRFMATVVHPGVPVAVGLLDAYDDED